MSSAEQYAHWVLDPANSFRTGRLIKLAAERFLNDLKRTDIYFDEVEASHCVNFIERYLVQWEGDWEGKPFILEMWQKFAIQNIYGWIRKDNGRRRFNKAYIQISKKNGKSSLSAGVSLFHLFHDHRVNTPKVFTAANNEDQAKICVNIAGRIVQKSPALAEWVDDDIVKLFNYKDNITEVVHTERNGFIKALPKETSDRNSKTSGGKHGINASLGIVDEFGMSMDYGASKPIETSMAARSERLMLYITTSGFNLEIPCYTELRGTGIKVLEGVEKGDNYFVMLFEIDPPVVEGEVQPVTVDYLIEHEEVWEQSNPNIDVSVFRDFLRDQLRDAKQYGGTTEVENLTLNFNIWMNSPSVFIPADTWNANTHGLSEDDILGMPCYGGMELVGGKYMNAFALVFPDIGGYTVIKPFFWMPENNLKMKESDKLKVWVDQGFIKTFLGDVPDNDKVFDYLYSEISKYQMNSFSYKNNLETSDIIQALIRNGVTGNPISHGYQGISTPTSEYESLATKKQFEHFGNPVMAWMNANCTAVRKENDIRIEKSGSKVVGVYATINALAQMMTVKAEGGTSIGILYI